ncbi:HD domain-containing protein [Paenibacillus paeoniae]|uniref:HD domain-containing protein n=1 Tax=Paenibacillus paeoniae TaxID=2292705 RepID=A0A371P6L4_9BACL|nr:HD domain-containing protein [Paenibacillus paeoniae]REK71587.1 HD domain-containing protein [Paenibacillus paeoniae]
MHIKDELYGEYEIDGVLEQLIMSKPVQRLKGIHQGGAGYLVNGSWNVTRYEHSIGVMLLIRKLGGSIEEQIAGLLHDVSHTAFSHVVDFALGHHDENYHEEIYSSIVLNSEIPDILRANGYSWDDVLGDDSKWTLLERPAPELCADRVDYTLRDMYRYNYLTHAEVLQFLEEDLLAVNGRMVLRNVQAAKWFVRAYNMEVLDFFMHPLNVYAYDKLAKALREAINLGLIVLPDLMLRDEEVWGMLQATDHPVISQLVRELHTGVQVEENMDQYDIYMKYKERLVDPPVLVGDHIVAASDLTEEVGRMKVRAREKFARGVYVRIMSDK